MADFRDGPADASMNRRTTPFPEGAPRLRLEGLGRRVVRLGDVELRPEHERVFALAVRLVMAEGAPVGRDELTDLLWPALRADSRRQSLRQLVYRLRQMGAPVEATPADLRVDTAWGEHDAASPDPVRLALGPAEQIHLLTQPWMPGWEPRWSSAMCDWLDETRSQVAARLRGALARALAQSRAAGRWDRVEALARAILRSDPLHEEGTLALAESLAATGSKAAALDLLDAYALEAGRRRRELTLAPWLLRERLSERPPAELHLGADSPFVGREAELERLCSALGRAKAGSGTMHVVVGEAGIGKSRLLHEFAGAARHLGVGVVWHTGDVNSSLVGFGAVAGLARALEERPGALGTAPGHLALLRALSGRAEGPVPEDALAPGPVYAALRDLLTAVTHEGPLVLLVDDGHLLDAGSLTVLGLLGSDVARLRLALVVASRPQGSAPLEGAPVRPGVVSLGPLTEAATRALALDVGVRVGVNWGEEQLAECVALSGGHPMMARELVVHWPGRVLQDGRPPALPELLRARVEALPAGALRLLQTVAVLGRFTTLDRLVGMTAVPPQDLVSQLASLDERGLLKGGASAPQVRHALLAEAALDLMPGRALGALHGFAARALLAEATAGASTEVVVDCATHFARSGEIERAAEVMRREAERLAGLGNTESVARLLPTALRELRDAPDGEALFRILLRDTALAGAYTDVVSAAGSLAARHAGAGLGIRGLGPRVLRAGAEASDEWGPWMAEALAQVADDSLPAEDRIGAALEGLRMGDGMHDVPYLRQIYATAQPLIAANHDLIASFLCEIVYHTDYGDLDRAVHFADSLVLRAQSEPSVGLRVEAVTYASVPRFTIGDPNEAQRRLESALDTAIKGGLHAAAHGVSTRLWDHGLFVGDETLVSTMMQLSSDLSVYIQQNEGSRWKALRLIMTAYLYPHLADFTAPESQLRLREILAVRIRHLRMYFLSAYVLQRISTGRAPATSAIMQLELDIDEFMQRRAIELPIVAMLAHLTSRGEHDSAKELYAKYLRKRRTRSIPAPLAEHFRAMLT